MASNRRRIDPHPEANRPSLPCVERLPAAALHDASARLDSIESWQRNLGTPDLVAEVNIDDPDPPRTKPRAWSAGIDAALLLTTMVAIAGAVLLACAGAFYGQLGVSADEVGLDGASVLVSGAPGALVLALAICAAPVMIVSFYFAVIKRGRWTLSVLFVGWAFAAAGRIVDVGVGPWPFLIAFGVVAMGGFERFWESRTKHSTRSMLAIAAILTLAFGFSWALALAQSGGLLAAEGKLITWTPGYVAWSATPTTVEWIGSAPVPAAAHSVRCSLYLGQSDGRSVFYDPVSRRAVRLPTASVAVTTYAGSPATLPCLSSDAGMPASLRR